MWSIKSFQRSNSQCDLNRLWLLEPDRFSDRHNPGGSAASFTAQSAICHCGNFIIKAELFLRALLLHRMLPSVSRQIWTSMYVYLTFLLCVYLNGRCACIGLKTRNISSCIMELLPSKRPPVYNLLPLNVATFKPSHKKFHVISHLLVLFTKHF